MLTEMALDIHKSQSDAAAIIAEQKRSIGALNMVIAGEGSDAERLAVRTCAAFRAGPNERCVMRFCRQGVLARQQATRSRAEQRQQTTAVFAPAGSEPRSGRRLDSLSAAHREDVSVCFP